MPTDTAEDDKYHAGQLPKHSIAFQMRDEDHCGKLYGHLRKGATDDKPALQVAEQVLELATKIRDDLSGDLQDVKKGCDRIGSNLGRMEDERRTTVELLQSINEKIDGVREYMHTDGDIK